MKNSPGDKRARWAFSLVEVVLALGVVGFAIVAILGVLPAGLQTSRGAQDETRAAQIAQSVFAALASQQFDAVSIKLYDSAGGQSGSIDLNLTQQNGAGPTLSANNNGEIFMPGSPPKFLNPPSALPASAPDTVAVYSITSSFSNAPNGFDAQFANQVTLSVRWPVSPTGLLSPNQTKRDFVRIISKY